MLQYSFKFKEREMNEQKLQWTEHTKSYNPTLLLLQYVAPNSINKHANAASQH